MMKNSVIVSTFEEIAQLYDVIVFEGAQGLSLDENNMAEYPNVTASSTKSKIPIERSNSLDGNVEICYITRSYFTRHGVGRLPDECDKSKINPNIEDLTNVHNDYQDYIRYAPFNCVDFCERVMMDSILAKCISTNPVKTSIFVSHLNYTDGEIFGDCTIDDLAKKFDITYRSSSKYAEDVIK
jgi:adenylosuccinate synthase